MAAALHRDQCQLNTRHVFREFRAPNGLLMCHGRSSLLPQAQTERTDPAEATRAFLVFVGVSPILALNAPFDRGFLARAVKIFVNQPFDNPWLDLAELAPALDPKPGLKALDEWLGRYGITVSERHSAAADAFATALVAARLLPQAHREGAKSFRAMQKMARDARWLNA